ncbi:MAG: DUF4248 domain-containing protein [Prevotellaceae bacterium]|jgi:hypothetical protein|nr:DUF4248 domain-containing protein [Prevotellaceae bacterium]
MNRTRLYTKKELRLLAGVSESTFRRYLNKKYFDELQKMGYEKKQKILTPTQYKYIVDKLVIVNDE